ncbi:restriction endonuclease subunit S [Paenibacillus sp. FSL H8-0317]|uniref:restriction endonuclease subunit S n=1 Tax=Paenibacillus sp. FSL H8-0317 TaxID=2921385 RepID=UPI003249485A
MSEHKENVPKLRFPGATGAWEKRYLSDVAQISSGGTPNRKESSYWNGTIPWATTAEVNYSVITDTKEKITLEGLNSSSAKLLSIGTILLAMYGQGKTRGKVAILGIEATTNQANANIAVSPIVNNLFLYYQLEKQYEILRNLANEGGQANLSLSIVKNISVSISSDLSEQEKIGNLFKQLDNLIILHQRKLNNVKNLKAGLLQKMFPKNGEDFPEVRFPGFTDAWEQYRLGELCDEFQSGKNINLEYIWDKGDESRYPVFGGNGLRGYTDTYNHDGIYALIGRQGALCGNMNLSYGKAYFTEHAIAVKANKDNETRFLFYLLGEMNLRQYSGQSAQPGLAVNKLIALSALIPTFEEQARISTFFSNLDNLISLHQRKLEHLQEQKKAMLQQMFV